MPRQEVDCPHMHTQWQPAQPGDNSQLSKKGVLGYNTSLLPHCAIFSLLSTCHRATMLALPQVSGSEASANTTS